MVLLSALLMSHILHHPRAAPIAAAEVLAPLRLDEVAVVAAALLCGCILLPVLRVVGLDIRKLYGSRRPSAGFLESGGSSSRSSENDGEWVDESDAESTREGGCRCFPLALPSSLRHRYLQPPLGNALLDADDALLEEARHSSLVRVEPQTAASSCDRSGTAGGPDDSFMTRRMSSNALKLDLTRGGYLVVRRRSTTLSRAETTEYYCFLSAAVLYGESQYILNDRPSSTSGDAAEC